MTVRPMIVRDSRFFWDGTAAGERRVWTMSWSRSYDDVPGAVDIDQVVADTERYWQDWADRLEIRERRDPMVRRSLLVLRALAREIS